MAYDVVIKNGTVIDGSKNSPFIADIGMRGDLITHIGALDESGAKSVIDAEGKYVTPGFIDITNHSDTHLTLFKYPNLESLLMQGVTTIIGGNCGASLAPLVSEKSLQAIGKWADPGDINVDWASMGDFLKSVDRLKPAANFGTFVGYGTLRRGIIGDEVRSLHPDETEKIKFLLYEAVREGAFGLSLGLSYGHERVSTTEEIMAISRILEGTNSTIKIHLRSEGAGLVAAINEAVQIGRDTGISIEISHFKAVGKKAWHTVPQALALIENARASRVDINFDVSPYATTGSPLYLLIPAWARQGGFAELFKLIDDPAEKQKIIAELLALTLHYDKILVVSANTKTIVGHTLEEIALRSGLSPEEALLETVRANEGRVEIIGRTVSLKNTCRSIENQYSYIASDAAGYDQSEMRSGNLVHPRSFGAFPHFLHRFVNERESLSPEEAVRKITSGPGEKIGIAKRGLLKVDNFADAVVFDPVLIRDRAQYRNPYRYPVGVEWVVVNGKIAVENGRYVEARAGRALRKGG